MSDWIYDRQVARAEKHWRKQAKAHRKAKRQKPKPTVQTDMIVVRLAPPYAAVHPVPADIQAMIDAGELR